MDKIAVLIPCYNESKTIEKVIMDFRKALPEAKIYVYDNNSKDGTDEIARKAGAIVRYERKQGKGNVIRTMFREIVIGDRLSSTYFTENKRPFHNSGNRVVRGLINCIYKCNIRDVMTGYRAFSYQFVKTFPVLSKGFEIETEMTIHTLDKNMGVENVIIEYRDRPNGSESKLNTFSDGFKVIKTIISLYKNYRPLSFFSLVTALLFIIGIIFLIPVMIDYFNTGLVPKMPSFMASIFFFICGIQSFFGGLILESIVKRSKQEFEIKLNEFTDKYKKLKNGD